MLAGSRSTEVALFVTLTVLTCIYVFRRRKTGVDTYVPNKDRYKKLSAIRKKIDDFLPIDGGALRAYAGRVVLVLTAAALIYICFIGVLKGAGYLVSPNRDLETELIRDDISLENISNSRFKIWEEYMELLTDRPVGGFSTRGALIYADRVTPYSYIAQKRYNPHSMFIQMMVQGGVVGFIIMIVFLAGFFLRALKRIKSQSPPGTFFLTMLSVVLIHVLFCFFNCGIFITPCAEAMLAWLAIGFIDGYCKGEGYERGKDDSKGKKENTKT